LSILHKDKEKPPSGFPCRKRIFRYISAGGKGAATNIKGRATKTKEAAKKIKGGAKNI
jgi:hypothetical protein